MKQSLFVISGATGMTGSELSKQILRQGGSVIGFDNFFASSREIIADIENHPEFSFFPYDLNDPAQMQEIQDLVNRKKSGFRRLVYINCAAVVHTEYFYQVESTFTTNVLGMRDFLVQAQKVGANTFLNCSTSEVYSMQSWDKEGGVREEDYLCMATAEHSQRTSYATGKLLTEFFLKDAVMQGKLTGCSVRFANVYSPHERYPKHIIPHIVTSLISKGQVTLLENAKQTRRTFLNNQDSCSAVLALLNTPQALDGSVYNVATQEEIAILDLVGLIAKKLNISNPNIDFQGYRESDPVRRVLSTEKIRTLTGWNPQVGLSEGLDQVIAAYQKRGGV